MEAIIEKRMVKNYDENLILDLEKIIDNHNIGKSFETAYSYYIVDVTGNHQVYFTLYRYHKSESRYCSPYTYIQNISIDIEKAVSTIIKKAKDFPILFVTQNNNSPLITNFRSRTKEGIVTIPIGKYKGSTLAEIWNSDRNYVLWFAKNYKSGTYLNYRNVPTAYKLTEEDNILLDQASELVTLFFEELTEKNKLESTSNYIGKLNTRLTLNAEVISINNSGQISLRSESGDDIIIYDNNFKLAKSDLITITGTPKNYFEKLGKKTTYLNRVKIVK